MKNSISFVGPHPHARFATRFARAALGLRALTAFLLSALIAPEAFSQKHYKDLAYPPLSDLTIPSIEKITLSNGLTLYLLEDHSLPTVSGYALIRTGDRFELAEKTGLASILGQVMRTGGSVSRKGDDIDRLLENSGSSVETGVETTSATGSLFALKENFPLSLEILADLLRNPAFPNDRIELAKVQERASIERRNDDVGEIADREFQKLIYAGTPYGRTTEYTTIDAITRDDLVAFHKQYFHPNQMLLGLWGDFGSAEAKALVEKHFGSWTRAQVKMPPLPAVLAVPKASVNLVQKDDVNQTNLRLGHLAGRFSDSDFYAMNVAAEVLGGGLSSRLFRRIRSDLALAYTASASWGARYDYSGRFLVYCNTKSETTVRAVQEILKELRRITVEPVSEDELRVAKDGILNSFVFNFDTKGEIVRRRMTYDYYGYPADFLQKFKENVEKVTAGDVLKAAQRNLFPDKLTILAAGKAQDFDQPLSLLGPVTTIDVTIPPPAAVSRGR